jgi:uncharacterized membrane protein required for colicin V production
VLEGYKKGFLKTAFSLVSWIVVLVICSVATPMVTQILIEKTDIEIVIQSALDAKIDEMISNALSEAGVSELQGTLPEGMDFEIPEELQAALPEELKNMLENASGGMNSITDNVINTAAIAESVVGTIALLIVLVFSRVAIMVVNIVLGIASKLPLIGPIDKVLGLACGAGKGLIWSWIILTVVSVLALTGINTEWAGYIAQSEFLVWLQENNIVINLLIK